MKLSQFRALIEAHDNLDKAVDDLNGSLIGCATDHSLRNEIMKLRDMTSGIQTKVKHLIENNDEI